ncbi:MAG: NAD(P)-binding domain-containing protein [Brevinema sp.]
MYKVAIVGAGPAGIAMAVELSAAGIDSEDILLLEKTDKINASIHQFYPQGKAVNSVYKNIQTTKEGIVGFQGIISVDEYYELTSKALSISGVNVLFNTEVYKIFHTEDGFTLQTLDKSFQAEKVVIACGVFSRPRKPDYPIPSSVLDNISYDIIKFQKDNITAKKILIVGGGDTAAEYAQTLSALGNSVTLSYRQDNFFRMNQLNKDLLNQLYEQNKINMMLSSNIKSLQEIDGKVNVIFEEGQEINMDYVVYSLGGASPVSFMAACGLAYDENSVDLTEFRESSIQGMFLAGDIAQGRKGGSLMLAFNDARNVMVGLHNKYEFPKPASL